MKTAVRILACVFAVLALVIAVGGVCFIFANRNAHPVLVVPSQAALDTASQLLQNVCDGDYTAAEKLILGSPDLGVDREAEGSVGKLIWEAYQDSISFTPVGQCFATESGVGQSYVVRYLDLEALTANLRTYSEQLLALRVKQAADVSQVYDSNNNYREDVVMEVLCDAAKKAIQRDAVFVELTITVNMVYRNGRWLAVPDAQLLGAITGGLVG